MLILVTCLLQEISQLSESLLNKNNTYFITAYGTTTFLL